MLVAALFLLLVPYLVILFYRRPLFLLSLFPIVNLAEVFSPFTTCRSVLFSSFRWMRSTSTEKDRGDTEEKHFLSMFLAMVAVELGLLFPTILTFNSCSSLAYSA
jgi:hypothetical protein